MPESVLCRGCGRRVVLPESINRKKARCPKCRTKLEAPEVAPVPKTPDAYEVFLSQSLELKSVQAPVETPEAPLELPEQEVLSLDDAPARPKKTIAPAQTYYPPPFRFAVQVLADSARQVRGPLRGVLTPHGLFLEKQPNRPVLYVPPGTRCKPDGAVLSLRLPDRNLMLRLAGTADPGQLAADTAAFLAGQRPVPLPAEYRRPWWLAGIGALLALGLAAGPIVLTEVADFELWIGLLLGVAFAFIATTANAGIALFTRIPTGLKITLMTVASAAVLGLFLVGAMIFLVDPPPTGPPPPPIELPPGEPTPPPPSSGPPSFPPTEPQGPPSLLDLVYRNGRTRLDDGSADVSALAISPIDQSVIIGYADGSTRIWPLDQPAYEPPRLGVHAGGAIHRIDFDSTGKFMMLSCDAGLVIASSAASAKAPVLIPGEQVVASLEPGRERFAAIRAGRVHVRLIPMALVKDVPAARAIKGFVTTTIKDETLPAGLPVMGLLPSNGKPTFLAWHPNGRLLSGGMDGSIVAIPSGGPVLPAFTSREHKAAVRAWAVSPWGDFVTGDDDGSVGYWPNKTTAITMFKTGGVAIKGLAFNPCGGEIAVVDASGWVSVWHPATGTKAFEVKQKRPVAAVAYGPYEDILMIADGKGVEVWWIPEIVEQASQK